MVSRIFLVAVALVGLCFPSLNVVAFTSPRPMSAYVSVHSDRTRPSMSEDPTSTTTSSPSNDPMMDAAVDSETFMALEKARRADELRSQEVFMQKATGKHICTNCDWVFDETKGDAMMIGGLIKPGTPFAELPSNWRCPVCRASKDSFKEEVIEIPGFAVNQGYGFGTNAMTAGQKNGLIFGGLGFFFVLFLSGYALN